MSLSVDERPPTQSALTDKVDFVTEDVAGQALGGEEDPISPRTMQRWREEGKGPPFYKLGQSIRYRLSEVLAWAATQRHTMTPPEYQRRPPAATSPSPAPIAVAPAEQPAKRKRGWPLGRKRGPRKAPTPTPSAAEQPHR
jgi:hypothetical protein